MKRKIIEIIIEDFECVWCGHGEYTVLNPYSNKREICCSRCGKINHCEYEVKNETWWNKIMNMIRRK